ncbi:MAG: ATP-binding protein [Aquisalimonadaceae bacterium]
MASESRETSLAKQPVLAHPDSHELYTWRPLRLLAVYRLLVAVILMFGSLSGLDSALLGADQPALFLQFSIGYFLFALLLLVTSLPISKFFVFQVCLHTLGDILILSLLIYAVGLEENGLGPLLLVAVAGGSIMVGLRLAALFAAVASIALLFQHMLHYFRYDQLSVSYTQVGLLGLAMFVGALATSYLAKRARESTALAEKRGVDLANLQALNAHIVQRLHDGAVVVDGNNRIRLLNSAAWALMGRPDHGPEPVLKDLSPSLGATLATWRGNPTISPEAVHVGEGAEVMPRCIPLGDKGGALLFLEDMAELRAQVQQAKLVSLGRLTASIAHEIRNPLSAITHAGQLLEEAELTSSDRRLLEIIHNQSQRLNGIIDSVLRMSRREQPARDTFVFKAWLREFADELSMQHDLQHLSLNLEDVPGELLVDCDPGHLNQVLNNLIRNAVEHGNMPKTSPTVIVSAGRDNSGRPWVEVRDNGKGISAEHAEHLFEPFFTTASKGTGLGLYLARELCESNQARLALLTTAPVGACFRITFSGPGMDLEHNKR